MSTNNNYYSPKRKRRRRIFYLVFSICACIWLFAGSRDKGIREPVFQKKHGTAVIITGAAAMFLLMQMENCIWHKFINHHRWW